MFEIVDPCNECVVRAACSEICRDRWYYTNKMKHMMRFYEDKTTFGFYNNTKNFIDEKEILSKIIEEINERNAELTKHYGSSSSSGISISTTSMTSVKDEYYYPDDKFERKIMDRCVDKLANAIDNDILQNIYGFFHKRKT